MKSILTVCVGNICRSPMAAGLLQKSLPLVDVDSAGIGALIGRPADPVAVDLMKSRNIDINNHVAKQINQSLSRNADLILVMDRFQKKYIEDSYPVCRGKIFMMSGSNDISIPDPYREDVAVFEKALQLIDAGAEIWVDQIKRILHKEEHQST